ncbi:MAG TPA: hypothetical protein VFJ97_17810 [Dermatophilaceae bacterium]|nr:hypothetical protein [Dermatophilaceae bacterium]
MTAPRGPHDRRSEPEEDPTGIRALLASLPEPGPMPAHLVERIGASLAREQAARTPADPRVTPIRRRRFGLPRVVAALGAVAAVAAIGVLGTNLAQQGKLGSNAGSAALGGASSQGAEDNVRTPAAPLGPAAVQVLSSGRAYTESTLAGQLSAAVDQAVPTPSFSGSGAGPSRLSGRNAAVYGQLATSRGLQACLQSLRLPQPSTVVVDLATYQGSPAAVILVTAAGRRTAHVVRPACSATNPAEIASVDLG